MAVEIKIHGVSGSAEYDAAETLARIFEGDLGKSVSGRVDLCPNLKLVGQKNKDVDLLVVGRLQDVRMNVEIEDLGAFMSRQLTVQSFAFVIEVKDHDLKQTQLSGNRIFVAYEGRLHDATQQAYDEMYSLLNFLKSRLGEGLAPWMCSFVWLRNISIDVLRNIGNKSLWNGGNTLPAGFSLPFLFRLACGQQRPCVLGGNRFFNSFSKDALENNTDQRIVQLVAGQVAIPSELTRRRIERLNSRILAGDDDLKKAIGTRLVVFAGRAGTGKTVRMLRAARELASEYNRRCLFLTYNRALVQDIRRLLFIADIPDAPDHCVKILTIHEFVRSVASSLGLLRSDHDLLDSDTFSAMCQEISEYLRCGALTEADLQGLAKSSPEILCWDHVFVDEAQDCTDAEKDLLFALFNYQKIVIADGVDQFLRGIRPCDWLRNVFVTKRTEERALRQKRNLACFANGYADSISLRWSVDPVDSMAGGSIYLCNELYPFEILQEIRRETLASGNDAYDLMFLVPPALVQKNIGFRDIGQFAENGFMLWDGTNTDLLRLAPAEASQHRLLQYASCRGLEAWTVVCIGFDEYIRHTAKFLPEPTDDLELELASRDEKLTRLAGLRALIPLTRAIDTLVLTLMEPNSEEAVRLVSLAKSMPDIVSMHVPSVGKTASHG